MSKIRRWFLGVTPAAESSIRPRALLLASLLAIGAVPGAETPAADPVDGESRTLVLFDGKSLDGWKKADFYGSGKVEVEDGSIVLHAGEAMSGMTGITSTREGLPRMNYELSYQARRLSGSDFFAAATFPVGEAYLTLVNGGWGGAVTGLSSLDGADASENDTSTYFEYKNGTWYTFRVRVTDQRVRCWIDDKEIVDAEYPGRHLSTRLEVRDNQPLGFATWETTGALRAITVRTLTPAEIAATNKDDE